METFIYEIELGFLLGLAIGIEHITNPFDNREWVVVIYLGFFKLCIFKNLAYDPEDENDLTL